jgi:hypothetical protein
LVYRRRHHDDDPESRRDLVDAKRWMLVYRYNRKTTQS